ncbi:MAG: AI-2E family transporter [Chloroflexales bacterium]|nr:AI-2E family transporter [Chloroflexales bacterium]
MSSDSGLPTCLNTIVTLAGVVLILAGLRAAAPIVTPILFALVFALIFHPIHAWLIRRGAPAWLALMRILVLVVTLFILLGYLFGDDYWIKDERGQNVLKVDGKLMRLRDTLRFEDAHGRELYLIRAKMVDIRETMDILRPGGGKAAVVHNAWFSPIRDRWQIDVPGGRDLEATGNIVQHEYTVQRPSRPPWPPPTRRAPWSQSSSPPRPRANSGSGRARPPRAATGSGRNPCLSLSDESLLASARR